MLFSSIIYGSQEAKRWDTTEVKLIQIRTHQFFTQLLCLSGNPFQPILQPVLVMQSTEDPSST
jgi:hypothetical protein